MAAVFIMITPPLKKIHPHQCRNIAAFSQAGCVRSMGINLPGQTESGPKPSHSSKALFWPIPAPSTRINCPERKTRLCGIFMLKSIGQPNQFQDCPPCREDSFPFLRVRTPEHIRHPYGQSASRRRFGPVPSFHNKERADSAIILELRDGRRS